MTSFSRCNPICCHGNQWSHLAEFRTHSSFYAVLITCKYEKDPIKNSGENVFPIISLWDFFIRLRAANSVVRARIRPNFELIQALMHVIVTCKYEKDPIKKHSRKLDDAVFPIITQWELSVAMETRVLN